LYEDGTNDETLESMSTLCWVVEHYVVEQIFTNIVREHAVSIFRLEE
jgi:hypothetical protein